MKLIGKQSEYSENFKLFNFGGHVKIFNRVIFDISSVLRCFKVQALTKNEFRGIRNTRKAVSLFIYIYIYNEVI